MNEKSPPSNEDSRLKESALESKCCAPANGELPKIGTLDPTRELENEEWPSAELPNREFLEFDSPRSGLKKSLDLDRLAQEDCFWRDQLLEARPAAGGRFELKEDAELAGFARENCVWRAQLLEVNPVIGGRFERSRRPPT
jgi:hypothetical protein